MKKNFNLIILTLLVILFACIIIVPPNNNQISTSNKKDTNELTNNDPIFKDPINKKQPKTANPSVQGHNYSFDSRIVEIANKSWSYENYNSTAGAFGGGSNIMVQEGFNGINSSFEFYITGLINASSPTKDVLSPNDIGPMNYMSYIGKPEPSWELFAINDDGPGKGNCSGYVHLNETVPYGASVITYDYDGITNVTYNATLNLINAISNKTVKATFIPTIENTKSSFIEWEIGFDNKYFFDFYGMYQSLPDEYSAIIELNDTFPLSSVLGKSGNYWQPLTYERNSTHLTICGSYEVYNITFYTQNLISITYNDKLELPDKNELHLNVTCKMAGNLIIEFTDTNGTTLIGPSVVVQKNDIINYNYFMRNYSLGGMGYLNITLTNGTDIYLGVKLAEVTFYKHAFIIGFTDNITAFEPGFYIGAAYLDADYLAHIGVYEGKNLNNDPIYCINKTNIANASVSYELEDYGSKLPYIEHPATQLNHTWLYLLRIDLREFQIRPDEYNITFQANELGYDSSTYVLKPWIVYKRNVTIEFQKTDDVLEVEQSFSFTIDLKVNYTDDQGNLFLQESYLRIPSQMNLSFINNDTGEIEGPIPYAYDIVQSFSLYDEIGNDTIPGIYYINVTIVSDYYQGSAAFPVEIIKRPIIIAVIYDEDELEEDNEFDLNWVLDGGNSKNRENMSMEVYIDGGFHKRYSLGSTYSGITKLELDEGEYYVTYRLISPFYTAEAYVKLEIEEEEGPDLTWLEVNWMWLLIGIIAIITIAALAVFLLVSRHKMKAKRELDAEFVALKTKTTATEQKISLFESQIAEIVSIYWIIIVHSEQGTAMVEIADFRFEKVLGEDYKDLIGKGVLRDSALIGGFLTAIRNFSRETTGTSLENQPVFNSQTDYSTIVDDNEIHRRILEGTHHFMAFVSSRGTMEISDILAAVNSIFQENYGDIVKRFEGAIRPFKNYESEVISYLHNQIRDLQKKISEEQSLLENYNRHLREVQDKIGIKPKKSAGTDYK